MVGSSGRQSVQRSVIENLDIYVPPLETQQKIGKILSMFDQKISLNKRMNKNLFKLSQELYKNWFVNFEYPISDHETYKSSGGKFKIEEGIEIPIDMKIANLSDVCDCQNGYAFYKVGYDEQGLMVIDLGNISLEGNFIYINADKQILKEKIPNDNYIVKKDDLVMVMTDRKFTMDLLGKTAKIYENKMFALNQRIYRIRPLINVNYVYSFLNNPSTLNILKSEALGSVQKYVNTDSINNLKIVIPNETLMEKFSKIVDPIFLRMENNIFQIKKLENSRDTLLPKLMSGEIDVSKIYCDFE